MHGLGWKQRVVRVHELLVARELGHQAMARPEGVREGIQAKHVVGESANMMIRTGRTARFIASVECTQALRVGNREGMVFPAHRVTGGLVLLAELEDREIEALYVAERLSGQPEQDVDLKRLLRDVRRVRASGFALNEGRSERGVVAIGCPVRNREGRALAGVSVSMPSLRYRSEQLPGTVAAIRLTVRAIEADLT